MNLNYLPFNRFFKYNRFYRNHIYKPVPSLIPPTNDNYNNQNCSKDNVQDENDVLFELFGLKLHYDDVLLISLIFFLYNEGVDDKELFISLILLLLS